MWRKGNLHTNVSGNVNWCSHYENSMEIPQKIKIDLPHYLAIPFLGIYMNKKTLIKKDRYTSMFIAVFICNSQDR